MCSQRAVIRYFLFLADWCLNGRYGESKGDSLNKYSVSQHSLEAKTSDNGKEDGEASTKVGASHCWPWPTQLLIAKIIKQHAFSRL